MRILYQAIFLLFAFVSCSKPGTVPPILILATNAHFGSYTGELLKAEGFNEFENDSLNGGKISKAFLAQYDLIILAEDVTDAHHWQLLSEFVSKGGNLIAFCPVQSPEELFGIAEVQGNFTGGYITIDTSSREGRSLSGRKLQLHADARLCELKGARPIAFLTECLINEKNFPGVVVNNYGKGKTAAFLYNLPQNIVLTRQGNPGLAGIEKDSIPGLRAMDMFTDNWVDTSNSTINQADEQMMLLSHIIEDMSQHSKPLPRLWYFPDNLTSLVTLTNDGEFRSENDFEQQFSDVDSMGAKMTLYVMETEKVSKQWTEKWTARGFEISGHPDNTREAMSPVWLHVDTVLTAMIRDISSLYGLKMTTVVNHWFVWCGKDPSGKPEFAAQAEIEASQGLSMDINYAHYDNNSNQGHFLGPLGSSQGNFTGSGLPMKFASSNGKVLNIYQHLNNVYDQQYNENHDPDGFFNCFKGLIDRSMQEQVYSFISIKSHNDEYYFSKIPLLRMLDYANGKGIPVWTAVRLADFLKMRDEAFFSGLHWDDTTLSFELNTSIGGQNGLTFMVPFMSGEKVIKQIDVGDKSVPFIIKSVRGSFYAMVTVSPGIKYSIVINYGL